MTGITDSLRRIVRRLAGFGRAERGGIAIQLALLALPMAVLGLGMVDVSRASIGKRNLQDALDAATLIAARSSAITDADLQSVGSAALTGQLTNKLGDATLTASSFKADGATVHGTATIKLTPVVANLWTNSDIEVGAKADVVRSMNKLEVALVLDNTGSMAGSKLTNLKAAATDFVDQLAAAAARSVETNPVKIGIVPFSNAVRIAGTTAEVNAYKSAAWMDVNGDSAASKQIFAGAAVNRFTLLNKLGQTWGGCIEGRIAPYDVQDASPSASTPDSLYTPYFWPDAVDGQDNNSYLNDTVDERSITSTTMNAVNTALGGLLSMFSNSDKQMVVAQGDTTKYNHAISGSTSSGPNKGCNMQPIMRLSTDWAALKSKISSMSANGETHIPLGMAWGWNLISPNGPFGDGVPYNTTNTTKVVVLMTDGENTYGANNNYNTSAYDGYGFAWQKRTGTQSSNETTRTNAIDARLAQMCTNMKAQGIVIYTVRVEVTSGSSALLQGCATTPDKFYDVQSASNLTAVFSAIAGSIQNLRISN